MTDTTVPTRIIDLAAEVDELGSVFPKGELARVAGVGAKQLTPSRLMSLGYEPRARLDTLWVTVSVLQSVVPSAPYAMQARYPEFGLRSPLDLLADGETDRVVTWAVGLAGGRIPEVLQPVVKPSTDVRLRPDGKASRSRRSTARPRPEGVSGLDAAQADARLSGLVARARSGQGLDFDHLGEVVERRDFE